MSRAPTRSGIPFVIAAPSGTGKTTICRLLLDRDPLLRLSVSHTTRPKREVEIDGVHYHFVSEDEFRALVEQGAFLEWARFSENLYGTSLAAMEARLAEGLDPLLEIEVQGAGQVREQRSEACLIFLLPPSLEALEARLKGRETDSDEEIRRRLGKARGEIERAQIFDYAVINDDLEATVDELIALLASVRAEQARAKGQSSPPGQAGEDAERLERSASRRILAAWHAKQPA